MSFIQNQQPSDVQRADQSSLTLVGTMKIHCKLQFDLAWKKLVNGKLVNKTVAEAQAFFDSLGSRSALSFVLHGKLQELIYLTDNSWVPLVPPHNYQAQQDGTVVISAKEE